MARLLDKFLKGYTKQDTIWWMQWIEDKIESQMTDQPPPEGSRARGMMDPNACWIADLAQEVKSRIPWEKVKGDGNILQSQIVSLILVLWTCRIGRAKTYNPARYTPTIQRKGYEATLSYQHALMDCIWDESQDHLYFPMQVWASPFLPRKKGS